MITEFVSQFGGIDILVNNPYFGEGRPFLEITEEIWDRTIDVCLKGFFLCSQSAAREMVRQGKGGRPPSQGEQDVAIFQELAPSPIERMSQVPQVGKGHFFQSELDQGIGTVAGGRFVDLVG